MNDNTINADVTMGGATGTLLAGRYRVVKQLGQGGMGSVWLAEDEKLDGHKVAIKMLPSVLVSNKRAYNQLKSEALVALKLTHPNIATVRAFEENEGNPVLVMDYIDGLTLDEYLAKKGNLSEETTCCLLEPVARALDYAHERGIVHRDVKPGNVMVTWDGDPYVLDFGIAREIQETMTRVTGKLSSGTLLYMSPEQLKGASPKPAQDVYSFAALAYECLKGEPPFCRGQVEWQIMNQEPEPLAGGALATSIMRGLAKDPVQRPATCRGVLAAAHPRTRPSFAAPRSKAETAKPAAGTPTNKVTPPLDLCTAVLKNKWLAFALIAVLIGVMFMNANRKAPGRPVPSPAVTNPQQEAHVDRSELDKAQLEAQVKVAACRRLDKRDGFGAKIEECENSLVRAKAEYDLKRWGDALRDYRAVFEQSVALAALDADRLRARAAAEKMGRQARAAKEAEADRYAAERFNAAKDLVVEAKKAFAGMRFAEALDKHELAARQFELSVGEAKAEVARRDEMAEAAKVRREREEAERLRKEEETRREKENQDRLTAERQKQARTQLVEKALTDEASGSNDERSIPMKAEKTVLLPNGVPVVMIWCGPGVLTCRRGRATVERKMEGFWISKYELTQRQWNAVMDENPSEFKNDLLPVENLSWNDCAQYVARVNARGRVAFRLPSGFEWEYAARGAHKVRSGEPAGGVMAGGWCGENSGGHTHEGGRMPANSLGICDMIGNVWEWCADAGCGADAAKRELRGGAFYTHNQKLLAVDGRVFVEQDAVGRGAGMRLVSDAL